MKLRFYRTAEPGGGSGAGAGNTDAGTNPPGAQGGDAANAVDPSKSAVSAAVPTGGSGAGEAPPQPKAPTTLEEANALLAERDKALADFETKIKAKDDVLKAKKEKFASKINQLRDAKGLRATSVDADFEPVKPRGADGKYTQQDLEDMQRQSLRKIQTEQAAERIETEMRDYVVEFAETIGLKEADVVKVESDLGAYRRLFALADGEKDTDPVADEAAQVQLFEDLLKGRNHDAIVEMRVKEAVAERDKYWAAKIGHAGAPEGGAGVVLNGPAGAAASKPVDPALASVAESIKRIRAGA